MSELSGGEIGELLVPYVENPGSDLLGRLGLYLDLLVRWNARTNLTAIRDPREIVRRHFGESLFAGRMIGEPDSLLDYGSGAGLPGIPIALLCPGIRVTLAESQGKKAAFLREAVRAMGLSVDVWGKRVEEMPAGTRFCCVVLRSVDGMAEAVASAAMFAGDGLVVLTTGTAEGGLEVGMGFELSERKLVPCSRDRVVLRYSRVSGD